MRQPARQWSSSRGSKQLRWAHLVVTDEVPELVVHDAVLAVVRHVALPTARQRLSQAYHAALAPCSAKHSALRQLTGGRAHAIPKYIRTSDHSKELGRSRPAARVRGAPAWRAARRRACRGAQRPAPRPCAAGGPPPGPPSCCSNRIALKYHHLMPCDMGGNVVISLARKVQCAQLGAKQEEEDTGSEPKSITLSDCNILKSAKMHLS